MNTLAEITATRSQNLLATHSVSTQERDNAVHSQAASTSTVESHRANVARLEELQSFGKIRAPFDGVITARNTDVGALVDAGASARQGLFRLGAIHRLRVYVPVPEAQSRAAATGLKVELTLDEFPGRRFPGAIARNASAIDVTSRTLLVEVDVDNPAASAAAGRVRAGPLPTAVGGRSVTIPANTLLFRSEGLRVGVVRRRPREPGADHDRPRLRQHARSGVGPCSRPMPSSSIRPIRWRTVRRSTCGPRRRERRR